MLRRHGSLAGWIVCLVVGLGACGDDDGPERDGGGDEDGGREDGGRPDGGRPDGGDVDAGPAVCGDGVQSDGEACDDGDTDDGDGCAGDCASVDDGFVCVRPGEDCVRVVTCGNGRIEGPETCDDRDATAGDGCDARCMLEPGWTCPVVGAACRAAACGDGIVAGFEGCDDGGTCNGGEGTRCTSSADCVAADDGDTCEARASDGCDTSCQLEPGAVCPTPGAPCGRSTCGDGTPEGTEECDDGNPLIGDGCTPLCTREPDCTDGTCVAVCGDGVVFAPETCDDANTRSGDGCSATCQEEVGFACEEVPLPDPPTVVLPVVMRDFIPACQDGNSAVTTRPREGQPGATPPYGHPDFQCFNGAERGMVETMLVDGRPVRRATATRISSAESFDLWYRSDDDFNRTVAQSMTFSSIGAGTYRFDASSFFPLSTPLSGPVAGFPTEGLEGMTNDGGGSGAQNFFFTSEVRFWFEYGGTETLAFSGDDDVWVFINERLAVDIGGVHGREDGSITLADCASGDPSENEPGCLAPLDLRVGGIYEAVVFQAERHTTRSQYRLTLANFVRAPSLCRSDCGDGVLAADEACDDGDDNGAEYDGCSEECRLTPYCGDGIVQEAFGETCDDGRNLGARPEDCAPGCQSIGARCGDGVVQTEAGEECDDGNEVSLDGCSAECRIELI
jgi:fibro-slime domain-containing protein